MARRYKSGSVLSTLVLVPGAGLAHSSPPSEWEIWGAVQKGKAEWRIPVHIRDQNMFPREFQCDFRTEEGDMEEQAGVLGMASGESLFDSGNQHRNLGSWWERKWASLISSFCSEGHAPQCSGITLDGTEGWGIYVMLEIKNALAVYYFSGSSI